MLLPSDDVITWPAADDIWPKGWRPDHAKKLLAFVTELVLAARNDPDVDLRKLGHMLKQMGVGERSRESKRLGR